MTPHVVAEVARGARLGHTATSSQLFRRTLSVVREVDELGDRGNSIYSSLVNGSAASTLDDGEAATIGYACEVAGIAVIDESKARSICSRYYPALSLSTTADLLLHNTVAAALGESGQKEAILNALFKARMQVPQHLLREVVGLIGERAASGCVSLPRSVRT